MVKHSARFFLLGVLLLPPMVPSSPWAAEADNILTLDINDAAALQEATRVLAEEIKLAARPQTYVILDLVARSVVIKARGAELHRLPIERWSGVHLADASTTFRLQARPPVARRKIEPAAGEQPPVSLADMPSDFTLIFSPSLSVAVHPSAADDVWRWLRFMGREWWTWLKEWSRRLLTGKEPATQPALRLTLAPHHAQSFAWTVTEGMPFLVRRTSSPAS
jgi:hypothetical protein